MNDKIFNLAKKLHALAKQGVGGEKENAQAHLERLCKKHGITLSSLEGDIDSLHEFKVSLKQKDLFFQIATSVRADFHFREYSRTCFNLRITEAEALEIRCKLDFYWPIWEK